jgi:hypothetical protein
MGTTIADMLRGRQVSELSPQELAQLTQVEEADRMAAGGQGEPTGAVQDIMEMVQSGTQTPEPESEGMLGGLVKMLAPLFAGGQPQPEQQDQQQEAQATPVPGSPSDDAFEQARRRAAALQPQNYGQ